MITPKRQLAAQTWAWINNFDIKATFEEFDFIKQKSKTGYNCRVSWWCVPIHIIAAHICNEKNNVLVEGMSTYKGDALTADEWVHMFEITTAWGNELKKINGISIPVVTKPIETIVSHNEPSIMSTLFDYSEDYEEIGDFVLYEQVSE